MVQLRVGWIGSGFMGKAHTIALRAAPDVFQLLAEPVGELLADTSAEQATAKAREAKTSYAIVIDTDPVPSTDESGAWWAVAEVSERKEVQSPRRAAYTADKEHERST